MFESFLFVLLLLLLLFLSCCLLEFENGDLMENSPFKNRGIELFVRAFLLAKCENVFFFFFATEKCFRKNHHLSDAMWGQNRGIRIKY